MSPKRRLRQLFAKKKNDGHTRDDKPQRANRRGDSSRALQRAKDYTGGPENLPADFLATVIATGRGSNAEKAAQHLALHKLKTFRAQQAPQQDLAGYFRERDQRELFPWKTAESAAKVQHDSFVRAFREPNPMENLKRIFLAQAKGGLIAPTENVVLQLLFGESDYARFTLASLLLTVPVPNRLAVHNWNVAASMAPARRESWGNQIASCPWPLFPDTPELMTLNSKLLSETAALMRNGSVQGGAAEPRTGVYAHREGDEFFGAGFCPLVGPDGVQTHALNTTELEGAIANMVRNRGGHHQANNNNANANQGYRGRGRGGRGGRRVGDAGVVGILAGKPRERMRGTRSQKTSEDSRRGDCRLFLS